MSKIFKSKKSILWYILGLITTAVIFFMFKEGVNDAREKENVKIEQVKSE